jgi:hypothetical protein
VWYEPELTFVFDDVNIINFVAIMSDDDCGVLHTQPMLSLSVTVKTSRFFHDADWINFSRDWREGI